MTVVISDADFTQNWTTHCCRHAKLKTTNGNNNEEEKGGRGSREEGEEEEKRKEVTEKGKEGKLGRGRKKRRKERRNGKKEQKTLLRKFFEPKPLTFRRLSLTGLNTQFQHYFCLSWSSLYRR